MIDPPLWPADAEDAEDDEPIVSNRWRRWVVAAIAGSLALLMFAGPVWRLIDSSRPTFAENGLAVCVYDYCDIQDAVRDEGLGLAMARLAGIRLDPAEAQALADDLMALLGERPVTVVVVARLPGDLAGQYSSATRTIEVEEPIRAWIVVHEAAHAAAGGHGTAFEEALFDLVRVLDVNRSQSE